VAVVDNASRDGTVDFLRSHRDADGCTLIEMDRNVGYAGGVNRAFAELPGRDVFLLNPDVRLSATDAALGLADFLARNPRVGVAAPRLLDDRGAVQPSARRFPSLLSMLGSLPSAGRVGPAGRSYERYVAPSRSSSPTEVDWVIGAAMLIRRAAYEATGGWDERFFLYMEDADFCRRCARAGWPIMYVPDVQLSHGYARASTRGGSVSTSAARRRHVASLARFFAHHPRFLLGR
jgi:N-acetylglucosaminyl-diphospho-decaprenol L-rhamnosyltransferase